MVMDISVRVDVKQLTKNLGALADKQIPFATAQALNKLGTIIKNAETANLEKVFPTLTPFTRGSVAVLRANKGNPTVTVLIKDRAARYLDPYEVGGRRVLNSRALLNPKDVALNQYGNLPKGKLKALKANPNVFIGSVTFKKSGETVSGVWLRPARGEQSKKGRRAGYGTKGDTTKSGMGKNVRSGLKLLIRFGDALPVKQRLHYQSKARALVQGHFRQCFEDAMAQAMATAKG